MGVEGMSTKNVIRKWYQRLHFPQIYDELFEELLAKYEPVDKAEFTEDAGQNFLAALCQCEALEQEYIRLGIDEQVLDATLSDVVVWTNVWYELTGTLGLNQIGWLKYHFSGRLFQLGRLQYGFGQAKFDIPEKGIQKGMPVLDIHIPAGEALNVEACKASMAEAKLFFAKHFPQFEYEWFTCYSWLLDSTLEKLLDKDSNILAFQTLFEVVEAKPSNSMLRYVFNWNAVRDNLSEYEVKSKLAERVKAYVLNGGELYEAYGVIPF